MSRSFGKLLRSVVWRWHHSAWALGGTRLHPGHSLALANSARRNARILRELLAAKRLRNPSARLVTLFLPERFGDMVASEPILRQLRRNHPDDCLVWICLAENTAIHGHHPDLDGIVGLFCVAEYGRHAELLKTGVPYFFANGATVCWVCQSRPRDLTGRAIVPADGYYHRGNLLQVHCDFGGIPRLDEAPQVFWGPQHAAELDHLSLPPKFAVLHTRSVDPARNWTDGSWAHLATWLQTELGLPVFEVGLKPLLAGVDGVRTDACGALSLPATAALIARASLFVGIDSGPAHFANAAGIPRVILLGHYAGYERYMPYSGTPRSLANARIIQWNGPASAIPLDHVQETVQTALATGSSGATAP